MPENIFFWENANGDYEVDFNGSHVVPANLKKAKAALDTFIEELTPEFVFEHNFAVDERFRKIEEEWRRPSEKERRKGVKGFVYLLESAGLHKIGRTKNMQNRMKSYSTENPHGIELIASIEVNDYVGYEQKLLEKYKDYQYRGEWFKFPVELIDEIKCLEM